MIRREVKLFERKEFKAALKRPELGESNVNTRYWAHTRSGPSVFEKVELKPEFPEQFMFVGYGLQCYEEPNDHGQTIASETCAIIEVRHEYSEKQGSFTTVELVPVDLIEFIE